MTKRFGFTLAGATHMDMQQKTVKNAFTLAEVLITLGIIGVVAAMTMPTLMNSTQGAQYKAAYKKALSALSQAVTLNVALDEWNFADADGGTTYNIGKMLTNRMNVVRTACPGGLGLTCSETSNNITDANGATYSAKNTANAGTGVTGDETLDEGNTTLFFNDGIMFTFEGDAANCTADPTRSGDICTGFIDVNGIKAPNKIVKCDTGDSDDDCVIKSPTDVYPVKFYDQTILPNSAPARAVLYSK
uniref:type II secretion system protein n=1 Tax=Candidatus Stercorousia sp. TaxID=3048886 RepID=UPI0040261F6C